MPGEHEAFPVTVPATSTILPTDAGVLLLIAGAGQLSTCRVPERGALVLGRDASCDVVLDHAEVSRRHAMIRAGTPPTVTDLGSTNGVCVGGRRLAVGEVVPLASGTGVTIGPFLVQLVQPVAPPTERAAGGRAGAMLVTDPTTARDTPVLRRIAESALNVLVLGETGVGKELLAQLIHRLSRRPGRFVALNCAALTESLLDSELFGHERGAFTGAVQAHAGVFEAAERGTLFLDEVGELSPALQAKLLRAVETRQILRVGSTRPIAVDVRFVAATHRDLRDAVARGGFREDLYYRMNGITLRIPPLRERPDAIARLVAALLDAMPSPRPTIAAAAMRMLAAHPWPGNVRELRNVLERAALLCQGGEIQPEHILLEAVEAAPAVAAARPPPGDGERARVIAALDACAGNQTRAARLLGISRATLVNRLDRFGVPRPRTRH